MFWGILAAVIGCVVLLAMGLLFTFWLIREDGKIRRAKSYGENADGAAGCFLAVLALIFVFSAASLVHKTVEWIQQSTQPVPMQKTNK